MYKNGQFLQPDVIAEPARVAVHMRVVYVCFYVRISALTQLKPKEHFITTMCHVCKKKKKTDGLKLLFS